MSSSDDDDDDCGIIVHDADGKFASLPFRDFNDTSNEMTTAYKSLSRIYFMNEYRFVPEFNIDKLLNTYKYHLLPIYLRFSEGKPFEDGKQILIGDQTVYFLAKPRAEQLFDPQSDLVFYQEFLFVEEKKLWTLEKKRSEDSHEAKIKQQRAVGREVAECLICYNEFLYDEIVRCSEKNHWICGGCLFDVINTNIKNNNPNRGCFEIGCPGGFERDDLKKILGKEMYAQFERADKDKILQVSQNKNVCRCPACNYGMYFEMGAGASSSSHSSDGDLEEDPSLEKYPVFDCPKCKKITCRRCKQADHRPKLCLNEAEESEDALIRCITNAMSDARIRHCPWCKTPVIKVDACNMITCSGCPHYFCYNCEWKLDDKDHYKHFGGVSQKGQKENDCPLFYPNNLEADQQRVRTAAEKAKTAWLKKHPRYTKVNMDKLQKIIDRQMQ